MGKERQALVHGYLMDREVKNRPDRLTRMGILAAAELYRNGEIDKICFTTIDKLSSFQVKRIKTLINIPEEDIFCEPRAVSTEEEVQVFKELAEENNWNNLLTIGNEVHLPRIKREIEKTFKEKPVEVTSPREVLSKNERYSGILSEMGKWRKQRILYYQEKLLNTPLIGTLILKTTPRIRRYKIAMQSWVFNQ